ncbi:hypothetical protein GGF32_009805 [Allomyces javanicus]|nr:hypothetical protein GGF32_009805 [Allomyces javanicus]
MVKQVYPSYFITGASSGLGRHLALELAARAAKHNWPLSLALTARRLELLEELKKEIAALAPAVRVKTAVLDVTWDDDAIWRVITECHAELGNLHCFVVNAGIASTARMIGASDRSFAVERPVLATNLIGAMATTDAAVRYIRENGINKTPEQAHIVGISSFSSLGVTTRSSYSVSKAALERYLDILRMESAGQGIHVTTIIPGYIDTPINQHRPHRPFLITAEAGAVAMANAMTVRGGGAGNALVPWWPWAIMWTVFNWIPKWLYFWYVPRMTKSHEPDQTKRE